MQAIKNFLSRFKPRSDRELMMEYLSEAKDISQLEHMMRLWDEKNSRSSIDRRVW
jgi:hypothetical protein